MTLRDDLARMEAGDAAATPEPWRTWTGEPYPAFARVFAASGSVARLPRSPDDPPPSHTVTTTADRNAAAIASARTDRPALVEMVKLLKAKLYDQYQDGLHDSFFDDLWDAAKRKAAKR